MFRLLIIVFVNSIISGSVLYGQDKGIRWDINNTENIDGNKVEAIGNPVLKKSGTYNASLWFDGIDDGLLIKNNPVDSYDSFTIEVIFKPDSTYPKNIEQRFVHIQDPDYGNRRILIELRMTENNMWYLDTFIKAETEQLTLADSKALHPAGVWSHAALIYDKGTMKHFVNGKEEISGKINYLEIKNAFTSIGTRMDKRSWYKGYIAVVKITNRALSPEEFEQLDIVELDQ